MCEAVIIDVAMDGFAVLMTVFIIAAIWGAALLVRGVWHRAGF